MLTLKSQTSSQHHLLSRLVDARQQTDDLFDLVRPDSFYERPIPERHRIIFYLGHLEAFDWNLLNGQTLQLQHSSPELDRLFAFGIDPIGSGLPSDQPADWPSSAEVFKYRERIRQALDSGFEVASFSDTKANGRPHPEDARLLLNVAIEHRLMHAETLSYMLHHLPFDHKYHQPTSITTNGFSTEKEMVEIPAGTTTLGVNRGDSDIFGWDNEYDANSVIVPAFEIEQHKVTNGEYLRFKVSGGYEDRSLWSEISWDWVTKNKISHPAFWIQRGDSWYQRRMFEETLLPLDWPVYVSYAEASAYARWAGKILPTEAQWHRAAYGTPEGTEIQFPSGDETIDPGQESLSHKGWDPCPVNSFPKNQSAFGVAGLLGNGWEWTSSVFAPFPGFQPFPFYPGYSADFFDGQHFVLKGGSVRTAACLLRRSFRNWFQPHYQYIYAGFRCVSN